jgi:hypothetical protein
MCSHGLLFIKKVQTYFLPYLLDFLAWPIYVTVKILKKLICLCMYHFIFYDLSTFLFFWNNSRVILQDIWSAKKIEAVKCRLLWVAQFPKVFWTKGQKTRELEKSNLSGLFFTKCTSRVHKTYMKKIVRDWNISCFQIPSSYTRAWTTGSWLGQLCKDSGDSG